MTAAGQVAVEQRLDELRDELAEVGMEPVDVLRPLALRQVALGPRELEVDVGVEGVLRRGHGPNRFDASSERLRQALQLAAALGHDVEANRTAADAPGSPRAT